MQSTEERLNDIEKQIKQLQWNYEILKTACKAIADTEGIKIDIPKTDIKDIVNMCNY